MRYQSFLLSLLVVAGLSLCSCAPDPIYSYPPEYENTLRFTKDKVETITLDNQQNLTFTTTCNAGDSITALIRVSYTGAYITSAVYHWTLRDASGEKVIERKVEQIAPHKQACPPMLRFEAPLVPGEYTMHFRTNYKYSAQTESGAIYGGYPTSANYEGASTVRAKLSVR